ncbi:MAG: MCE family protein [Akkermansiaceae bacterium]|nr:MCE family protein [Armatimonadota bacterium]
MTAKLRHNVLVGVTSIAAVALLIFSLQFLAGNIANGQTLTVTVVFKDAHGVQEGSEVRMSGVQVGRIAKIALNDQKEAEVRVRLEKTYPVPVDSRFVVQGSVLGNTSLLNIVPGNPTAVALKDGDRVVGELQADLQTVLASSEILIPELQKTLQTSRETLEIFQRVALATEAQISDPRGPAALRKTLANIEGTTGNLNRATASLPRISANAEGQLTALSGQSQQLLRDLDAAAVSGGRIAKNGEALSANLNGTLQENRKTIKALLESVDESASALAGLLNQAGGLINDPDLKKNLLETTANIAATTARLEATTGNLEKLSGDPRLTADLRDTVANLKETTESIKNVAARVETIRIPGERRQPGGPQPSPAPPRPAASTSLVEPGLAFDSFYDTTDPRFRADVNYTLRRGNQGRFYRAGLYDLTERNGLNLQIGQEIGQSGNIDFAYRYGLLAGKFGLGLDANVGPLDFRLDAFDPNRLTGNARAKLYLNRDRTQSLLFGIDDFARDNRAVIGVQIRQ